MNKKYKLYLLIGVVLIGTIIILLFYTGNENKQNKLENFENEKLDFSNIKNLKNTEEIQPYNEFKQVENPVDSNTVLVQSSTPEGFVTDDKTELRDSYYKISTKVIPGKNYKLSGWCATSNDWNGEDNLFNIRFNSKDKRNIALSDSGNKLKDMVIKGLTWKYVIYPFKVPENVNDIMDVFLGYKPNNTKGKRYITGIQLDKTVVGDDEFPNSDNLQLFLNASNSNNFTYKKYWNDKSGNDNNFMFEKDPIHEKNYYIMKDRKIIGPSPKKIGINNNNFTISFMACSMGGNVTGEALIIPGNEEIAFGVTVPNAYGQLVCEVADKKYPVDQKIITENNTVYSFVYHDKELDVYINDKNITTFKTNQIYFNNSPIIINPQRNWNARLYGLSVFNRALSEKDIKFLNSYYHRKVMDNIINEYEHKEIIENFSQKNNTFVSENNNLETNCPMVFKKKKDYLVNIDKKSDYALKNGMYGELFLGRDYNKVKNTYKQHFKKCDVEGLNELDNNFIDITDKKPLFSDSFVRDKSLHPNIACPDLFDSKDGEKLNLSNKCKNSIRAHCENQVLHNIDKLSNLDNICKSFHPMFSDTPESQEQLLDLHSGLLKKHITK